MRSSRMEPELCGGKTRTPQPRVLDAHRASNGGEESCHEGPRTQNRDELGNPLDRVGNACGIKRSVWRRCEFRSTYRTLLREGEEEEEVPRRICCYVLETARLADC